MMRVSELLQVAVFLHHLPKCFGFNIELLENLKSSYSNFVGHHCPNGYLLTTIAIPMSTSPSDSNWTHLSIEDPMTRLDQVTSQTCCSLTIISEMNGNQTWKVLKRVQPFRSSFIILVLPDSQGLSEWYEVANRAHSAFFAMVSDGTETLVRFFLICPFGPFADYNRPFVVWRAGYGFTADLIERFKGSCHGIHSTWAVSYVPFVPTTYQDGVNGTAPYGFEVDVAKIIAQKLGVNFKYEWHGWSFERKLGYEVTKQLIEISEYKKPFGIGVRLVRNPNEVFADFTGVFYFVETFYASRMPKKLPNYLSAVNVFSTQTWFSAILVNLIFSFALYAIHKCYLSDTLSPHVETKPGQLLDFVIRINLGLTEPERFRWFPSLCGASLSSGAFYISTMVLCLSFTSTLLSVLVKVEREHPVDNSRDAWRRGATLYFTSLADYVHPDLPSFKLFPKDLQKASLLAIKTGGVYDLRLVSNIAKYAHKDIAENGAVFGAAGARTSTTRITALSQNLYEAKENLISSIPGTFFVPKYAPWGPRVSQIQARLLSSGIVDHIAKKYVLPKQQPQDVLIPLTFEHLATAWILLAVGSLMSILIFARERNPCKRKGSQHTPNRIESALDQDIA
ncbi:uncharacterized protein LOC131878186 [Tigriopus californicus]|uniref:uncharacterized protein LOC131878186 n=1 Tax=Tigriopus californicus TaxID=6832 RepID=UPI0027DA0134|nr:uncharacterized protein LOC131878186 [Tigriopus californicus]